MYRRSIEKIGLTRLPISSSPQRWRTLENWKKRKPKPKPGWRSIRAPRSVAFSAAVRRASFWREACARPECRKDELGAARLSDQQTWLRKR